MDQTMPEIRARSVVIVEDDASLRAALAFALEADGFTVHAYGGGEPLLAEMVRADCMVVDMRLPDIDGLTLINRLRQKGVWEPAILTTTNPDERTRRMADRMGVRIVEKPLITGELRREIEAMVAGEIS
jgi:DNA-binding response OmpR family regulator